MTISKLLLVLPSTNLQLCASYDTNVIGRSKCWIWAKGYGCWKRLRFSEHLNVFGTGAFWLLYPSNYSSFFNQTCRDDTSYNTNAIDRFLCLITWHAWMLNLNNRFQMLEEVNVFGAGNRFMYKILLTYWNLHGWFNWK